MPHKDVERALQLALGLDIPFWPQLPNVSYYEDMYAQASEHFPGMTVDVENKKITFDTARFEAELAEYSQKMADPAIFNLSKSHSAVYRNRKFGDAFVCLTNFFKNIFSFKYLP